MPTDPTTAAKPPIYLLDSMAFIFRAYHAMQRQRPMTTRTGIPTAATYVFVNMINKLRKDFAPQLSGRRLRPARPRLPRRARPRDEAAAPVEREDAELR